MKVITVALVNERWCNARFIVVQLLLFMAHGLCIKSKVFLLCFLELSDPKVARTDVGRPKFDLFWLLVDMGAILHQDEVVAVLRAWDDLALD